MVRTPAMLGLALLLLLAGAPVARVHATTQTIPINESRTFNGITVTITGTITIDTTAKTITGSITVKAVNATSGQTIFQETIVINKSFSTDANFILGIPTFSGMLAASCSANTSTGTSSCAVTRSPDLNYDGRVDIVDMAAFALGFGSTNSRLDLNGDGRVDILDMSIAAIDFDSQVFY